MNDEALKYKTLTTAGKVELLTEWLNALERQHFGEVVQGDNSQDAAQTARQMQRVSAALEHYNRPSSAARVHPGTT
jgi:hypothetical protein